MSEYDMESAIPLDDKELGQLRQIVEESTELAAGVESTIGRLFATVAARDAELERLWVAIKKLRDASGQAIVDAMRELFALTEASR
jgi:hypothetical protein